MGNKEITLKQEFYPKLIPAIILTLIHILVFQIGVGLLVGIVYKTFDISLDILFIICTVNSIGFILLLTLLNIKYNLSLRDTFRMTDLRYIKLFFAVILFIMGGRIFALNIGYMFSLIVPIKESLLDVFDAMVGAKASLPGQILLLVIIAPITEEIVYRGLILKGLLKHYSVKKAIIISSLLFAFMHFNIWQGVIAFVLGLLLAWIYIKTKSITPCILAHALHNFLIVLVSRSADINVQEAAVVQPEYIVSQILISTIIASVMFFIGRAMLNNCSC